MAPPFTGRRLVLQLGQYAVRHPVHLGNRLNRRNLESWRSFRKVRATCNLCGHVGPLLFEMPDRAMFERHHIPVLRETLRCGGCHSKMRDRTVAAGLLDLVAERYGVKVATVSELAHRLPTHVRVLDTDAHSRVSTLMRGHPGWVRSLYLPEKGDGEVLGDDRFLNVNLERMPFPDGQLDVVITSEVMEHVRFVDVAHREIARCLKPEGTYLFTVPYDPDLPRTWQLIDPFTDHPLVHPPHIHGDPMLRGGIKSYRVFGRDLVEDLAEAGLHAEFREVDRAETGIFAGDLFVATPADPAAPATPGKPAAPESSATPAARRTR